MLQAYASEPQRAESPPTPAVPPVSYFLTKEPVVTSYITPLPQPVPMPGPPAQAMQQGPMQQAYASQGELHPVPAPNPCPAWYQANLLLLRDDQGEAKSAECIIQLYCL